MSRSVCAALKLLVILNSHDPKLRRSQLYCSFLLFMNTIGCFDEFTCKNNECVDRVKMCNGIADCSDSSDESDCSKLHSA